MITTSPNPRLRRSRLHGSDLLVVILVAAALRLAHLFAVWDDPFFRQPILDARYYLSFAEQLVDGRLFGAHIFRGSPLMGYFVAALHGIFGPSPGVVPAAQIVLGSATTGIVAHVGGRLGGRPAGLVAGLLYAGCWTAVLYTTLIVPATLAIFLAAWGLKRALDWELRKEAEDAPPTWSSVVIAGSILALATLARERYGLFSLTLLGWWLWRGKARLRMALGLGAPLLLALGLTTLNNGLASGDLLPYSANGGINFYIGNGPGANGRFHPPRGFRHSRDQMYEDAREVASRAAGRALSPSEVERYWYRETFRNIAARPIRALGVLALKLSHLTGSTESWDVAYGDAVRRSSLPLRFCLFGYAAVGILGWGGLLLACRQQGVALVWGLVLSQIAFMMVFFAGSRFRLGIVAPLAIGAGLLVSIAWRARAERCRWRSLLPAVGISALAVLLPLPGRDASPRMEATFHANRALSAIMRHAMEEAGREARAALRIDPDDVSAHIYLGRVLLEKGALDQAEQHFRRAGELRPRDTRALVSLGVVALDRHDPEAADRWFRAVLEIEPENAKANFERSVYLLRHGDRKAALRHAARIAGHPRYRDRLKALGLQ